MSLARPGGTVSKSGVEEAAAPPGLPPADPLHRCLPLSTGTSPGPSGHFQDGRGPPWGRTQHPDRQAPRSSLDDQRLPGVATLGPAPHALPRNLGRTPWVPTWAPHRCGRGSPHPCGDRETGASGQPGPGQQSQRRLSVPSAPATADACPGRGRGVWCLLTPGPPWD